MKEADFPPSTIFVVKHFVPFAVYPGFESISEREFSFATGRKARFSDSGVNLSGSSWPVSMPFDEWLKDVEDSAL